MWATISDLVNLFRRCEIRIIRDDLVKVVLRGDAQHIRLRAVDAVTQ